MTVNDKSFGIIEASTIPMKVVEASGKEHMTTDTCVCEHMISVFVNENMVASLVCTPLDLEYLVIGRLMTEKIINDTDDIDTIYICDNGNTARVYTKTKIDFVAADVKEPTCCTQNKLFLQSGGGLALTPIKYVGLSYENVFALTADFASGSKIHGKTKGTHSSYLQYKGDMIFACEDIGRHNALDKCIGYMAKNKLAPLDCLIFTTGRVPTDMVKKAVAVGLGGLVSKAVPTDAAIKMAGMYNLNLICKAWPDSFVIANESKND